MLEVDLIPGWTTYLLDTDTGELSALAAGVVPIGTPSEPSATRLFMAGGRAVIRWSPATGEHRTILPPFAVGKLHESSLPL